MTKLFLGFDVSTQSLSALIIDLDTSQAIYETSLNYDLDLPHYQTQNGVLPNHDPLIKLNLMDIHKKIWSLDALNATAPDLLGIDAASMPRTYT